MAYGRKLKGTSRRVPITVHAPLDRLDAIDEYVISIHTFLAEGDCKNIYNYFFIMHIFMHYILSYL